MDHGRETPSGDGVAGGALHARDPAGAFLSMTPEDVTRRARLRYEAFLDQQLAEIPENHPLHEMYQRQRLKLGEAGPRLEPLPSRR